MTEHYPHALPRNLPTIDRPHQQLFLKLLAASAFLPEGLSLFLGDFRLPLVRIFILFFAIGALRRLQDKAKTSCLVRVPSDIFALAAGAWIILASVINSGVAGLKGGGAPALEFTGSYYVVRHLLGPLDSSVQLMKFSSVIMVLVVCLALLDPLSGHLFVHDLVANITGYIKPYDLNAESYFRNGQVRAMGPLEHSILFGMACAWFGIIALLTFRFRLFGLSVACIALIGVWFSQSRGTLAAYGIGLCLMIYYFILKNFTGRWKVVAALLATWVAFVFAYSRSPLSTLLTFGGVDPAAGWYRQAIWETAGPLVLGSPIFGIESGDDWGWRNSDVLMGPTVDSLWLESALIWGIPASVLICLTVVSAFWLGPVDRSVYLSDSERRLSVALGIVIAVAVFLGFTVHFWGTCWVLLGMFPAIRAHLAEAAITRTIISVEPCGSD